MAGTITHQWTGTVLTITSDSGTSSCDLKGAKGDDGARGAQGAPGSSVAEDSQKLGGVAAAQYALKNNVPAHNLLDNSWFVNPINQRGATSYSSQGYSIDRWKSEIVAGTSFSISVSSGKLIISKSGGVFRFYQILNNDMLGKTVTYAVKTSDGIFSGTCVVSNTINNVRIGSHNAYLSVYRGDGTIFSIFFDDSSDDTIEIYWAALYEGSYDASTLPAYQPKGYAAELAECQRYYRPFINAAPAMSIAATAIEAEMALEPPMRVVPTITINSVGSAYTPEGVKSVSSSYSSTNTVNKAGYVFYTPSIGIGLSCVITGIDGYLSADL